MRLSWTIICLILLAVAMGASLVSAGQIEATRQPPATAAIAPDQLEVTPTIDRLAAPPTVDPPTQADEGAQLFWLWCQPCHGDKGQGLTDEWRAQYPEEDQNCWARGCHGKTPYEEGFTLPTTVPAVIGEGSLFRYSTVGQVFHYTRANMPYEYPGVLSDEEYLAITAFLAREHGTWDGSNLTVDNVEQLRLRPASTTGNRQPGIADDLQSVAATPVPKERAADAGSFVGVSDDSFVWIGVVFFMFLIGGGLVWFQRKR